MTIDRSGCPAPRHGTEWAYDDEGCRCPDAVVARSTYRRGLRQGVRRLVDATRTSRQIQGLAVAGWRFSDLSHELDIPDAGIARIVKQAKVTVFIRDMVDQLTDRLRDRSGSSNHTTHRAQARLWLPLDAWDYGDINSTHRLAEVTALLGWLDHGEDPLLPVVELIRRFDSLPLIAQQITIRRGRALYRAGCQHAVARRCEQLRWHHRQTRRREGIAAA